MTFSYDYSVLAYVIGSKSHLSNCRHGREALEKERINEQLNQLRDIPVGKFQSILKFRAFIPPIYLHLIFGILQFQLSSLVNLILSLFQT